MRTYLILTICVLLFTCASTTAQKKYKISFIDQDLLENLDDFDYFTKHAKALAKTTKTSKYELVEINEADYLIIVSFRYSETLKGYIVPYTVLIPNSGERDFGYSGDNLFVSVVLSSELNDIYSQIINEVDDYQNNILLDLKIKNLTDKR